MTLRPEPTTRTLRDLRRGQILSVARGLVAEGGLEALTIARIEAGCDFSRGVITYHFRNKDEIVAAVLESAIQEIEEGTLGRLQGIDDASERVRIMLRSTLQGFLQHREAAHILLSFWGRIPRDEWATRMNAELYAGFRTSAAQIFEKGQDSGDFADDLDVESMAALSVALVIGIAAQVYFQPGAIDPTKAMDEAAESLLARVLR